ncbi:hypothetical protein C789_317 [Microcystis aeruginosa FACHB-905 = DIANCHI905]|nr:hypothetical protein C789_317 [Microcystis aeruginosa FACHB-905 = DIANCHI905]
MFPFEFLKMRGNMFPFESENNYRGSSGFCVETKPILIVSSAK